MPSPEVLRLSKFTHSSSVTLFFFFSSQALKLIRQSHWTFIPLKHTPQNDVKPEILFLKHSVRGGGESGSIQMKEDGSDVDGCLLSTWGGHDTVTAISGYI